MSMANGGVMKRSGDTTPGSEGRAIRRALRSPVRHPDVSISAEQLARMTEAELDAALHFHRTPGDSDHDETRASLDRAVHALIEMEMDKQAREEDR